MRTAALSLNNTFCSGTNRRKVLFLSKYCTLTKTIENIKRFSTREILPALLKKSCCFDFKLIEGPS